jgi:outer membrane protein assembly factor BamA
VELDEGRYARTEPARFDRRFNLEIAAADAAFIPGFASRQGAVFVLSDLLADNLIFFSLAAYQQSAGLGGLVRDLNGSALYVNQSRRLNWGVGAFRLRGRFYEGDFDQVYEETSAGGYLLVRYPLSRFTRVEARWQLEHSDRIDFTFSSGGSVVFPRRRGVLTSQYLSYIRDNSLWVPTGPIDGSRVNITGGIVTDLQNARFDSWLLSADLRRYVRTGYTSAVAVRTYGFFSGGERPERISLGGSLALRGYPRFSYVAGSSALMLNTEWRFTITDYLTFGFPFGDLRFPGVQMAFFGDVGRAWSRLSTDRGWLGSYGLGWRMSLGYPFVLRLDLGWRYGALDGGYYLPGSYRSSRFVDFWFGFNY